MQQRVPGSNATLDDPVGQSVTVGEIVHSQKVDVARNPRSLALHIAIRIEVKGEHSVYRGKYRTS